MATCGQCVNDVFLLYRVPCNGTSRVHVCVCVCVYVCTCVCMYMCVYLCARVRGCVYCGVLCMVQDTCSCTPYLSAHHCSVHTRACDLDL